MAPSGSCSRCGKHATLQCRHVEPNGSESYIVYCSKECQVQDWPQHKTVCQKSRQRARLFKAGDLIKTLGLLYCETINVINVDRVQVDQDGYIHVFVAPGEETAFMGYRLDRFNLSEAAQQAIFSDKQSSVFVVAMRWLMRRGLQSFGVMVVRMVKVKEDLALIKHHAVKRRNDRIATAHYASAPSWVFHNVVVLRLEDGTEYAVDPLGACFKTRSKHRPIRPWAEYEAEMVEEVIQEYPFSNVDDTLLEALLQEGPGNMVQAEVAMGMREFTTEKDILAAIKLPQASYEVAKQKIVDRARTLAYGLVGLGSGFVSQGPGVGGSLQHFDRLTDYGKSECGVPGPGSDSDEPQPEAEVLEALEQKYGVDQTLVEQVKQARATDEDDDFAEVGNRCFHLQQRIWTRQQLESFVRFNYPNHYVETGFPKTPNEPLPFRDLLSHMDDMQPVYTTSPTQTSASESKDTSPSD